MVKPFFRPSLRLQWKLTFSYTWITVTTLLILMLIGIIAGSETAAADFSQLVVAALKEHASELVPYLSATPPDRAGIERWLQQPENLTTQVVLSNLPRTTFSVTLDGLIVVVDQQGAVVASRAADSASVGPLSAQQLPRQATAVLRVALVGQTDERRLVTSLTDGTVIAAYPLVGAYSRIEGALVAQTTGLSQPSLLFNALFASLIFSIPVAILAALIGTLFGFFTARGFSRRFKRLSSTVDQWSQGNFAVVAQDPSGDELGQLTRRLNHMTTQVQALVHSHQQLAMLEERNRLARDLHDSVKQQIFAISMLLNSAKGLLRSDLNRAQTCLEEIDTFVQHVQQELTSLVQALHPAALEEKGLVVAVRELASQWSHQSSIAANIRVQGDPSPSVRVAETLFRIVQEALANVARHSRASMVEITLTGEQGTVMVSINDNGQGFELTSGRGSGLGLLSMQERMRLLEGTLLVESAPGQGTRITVCCSDLNSGKEEKEGMQWSRSRS
jgi:NarL family two-component system sensor histidine kinase LiaS